MSGKKISAWGMTSIVVVPAAYFLFIHFAVASDTAEAAQANTKIIKQLSQIHARQDSADQARHKLTETLCLSGKLSDVDDCAEVGVKVLEK